MAAVWTTDECQTIEAGIARHPLDSGRCAALARVVYRLAHPKYSGTRGRQISPGGSAARYVVPRVPHPPLWGSHTFVDAQEHSVDAITGAAGYVSARYLEDFWMYHEHLTVQDVDVDAVDPGIEDGT